MTNAYIIATGATPVAEHYTRSLADLASEAMRAALKTGGDAVAPDRIGALYVANAFGESLGVQGNLGAAVADACGLSGVEATHIAAAGASGGAALRQATLAIASGAYDLVAVVGVEKVMDRLEEALEVAQALGTVGEYEADQGVTLTGQWALLMRRYMHEFGYEATAFAPFPVNAHANATKNPNALYRFAINADKYRSAPQIASPLNMLDCSTVADGAAVLLLASERVAREVTTPRIRVAGSALATDALGLYARRDPLHLAAAQRSGETALRNANLRPNDVQVLELTDPHGIAAALALEAMGFYERGSAPRHAADGAISPTGATPLATLGGYKARGDVGGATGVYQALEVVRQLSAAAGPTQVANARVGLVQSLAGVGATAVTHILVAE